jgi:hypothetical protein
LSKGKIQKRVQKMQILAQIFSSFFTKEFASFFLVRLSSPDGFFDYVKKGHFLPAPYQGQEQSKKKADKKKWSSPVVNRFFFAEKNEKRNEIKKAENCTCKK